MSETRNGFGFSDYCSQSFHQDFNVVLGSTFDQGIGPYLHSHFGLPQTYQS